MKELSDFLSKRKKNFCQMEPTKTVKARIAVLGNKRHYTMFEKPGNSELSAVKYYNPRGLKSHGYKKEKESQILSHRSQQ